jgi:hypothetical protein
MGISGTVALPDDQWDWHEVVQNSQFTTSRHRAEMRRWNWRWGLRVVRRDVLPLLVTAMALTMALLTLVGLVAHPLPWPGGSSSPRVGAAPPGVAPSVAGHFAPAARPPVATPGRGPNTVTPSIGPATPAIASVLGDTAGTAHAGAATAQRAASPTARPTPKPLLALPATGVQLPATNVEVSASVPLPLPGLVALPPVQLGLSLPKIELLN